MEQLYKNKYTLLEVVSIGSVAELLSSPRNMMFVIGRKWHGSERLATSWKQWELTVKDAGRCVLELAEHCAMFIDLCFHPEKRRCWTEGRRSCLTLLVTTVPWKWKQEQKIFFKHRAPSLCKHQSSSSSSGQWHSRSCVQGLSRWRKVFAVRTWPSETMASGGKLWGGRGEIHIQFQLAYWIHGGKVRCIDSKTPCSFGLEVVALASLIDLVGVFQHQTYLQRSGGGFLSIGQAFQVQGSHNDFLSSRTSLHGYFAISAKEKESILWVYANTHMYLFHFDIALEVLANTQNPDGNSISQIFILLGHDYMQHAGLDGEGQMISGIISNSFQCKVNWRMQGRLIMNQLRLNENISVSGYSNCLYRSSSSRGEILYSDSVSYSNDDICLVAIGFVYLYLQSKISLLYLRLCCTFIFPLLIELFPEHITA